VPQREKVGDVPKLGEMECFQPGEAGDGLESSDSVSHVDYEVPEFCKKRERIQFVGSQFPDEQLSQTSESGDQFECSQAGVLDIDTLKQWELDQASKITGAAVDSDETRVPSNSGKVGLDVEMIPKIESG
jgi:hypothetical protein